MPSELSRKLDDFRTKQKVVPVTQKVSFLFEASRVAGLDILSLAIIARKSLLDLAESEPSLSLFEDLFVGTDKNVEFLSQEEHAELVERIKRLLSFLSCRLKDLDAQQCVEYLIQKYRIHVYNGEDLILCALPYHDTPLFGKLVKIIPFFKKIDKATPSETRWMFLRNVNKTGSALARQVLVKMCRSSQPVMTSIIDHVIDCLKYGAYNEALLSFANVLLLEVLSEFSEIKYDISISLFSLCRICFKASQKSVSAFFMGLTLSIHIVCVADVREDALGILLSRAVSACPSGKTHALLMGLNMVAKTRGGLLPKSVIESIEKLSVEEIDAAVKLCAPRSLLSFLKQAAVDSEVLHKRLTIVEEVAKSVPQVSVAEPHMDETSDSESSTDEEEEEDPSSLARKVLNDLLSRKDSSTDEIKRAIQKYAKVPGTSRLCIRLAAKSACIESLRCALKSLRNDAGFVPILVSVLDDFGEKSSDPFGLFESIFWDMEKVPGKALLEVAGSLGIPEAAALMAIVKKSESDFFLSAKVWQKVAVVAAGASSQLSLASPIADWKFGPWKMDNVKDFCATFIEYANRQTKTVVAQEDRIGTVYGQLMCAITIPGSSNRKALTSLARKSFMELSDEARCEFLALIASQQNLSVIKKLNEVAGPAGFDRIPADCEKGKNLLTAVERMISECPSSPDCWILTQRLIEAGLHGINYSCLVSGAKSEASFKCISSWMNTGSDLSATFAHALIDVVLASPQGSSNQTEMETLLTLFTKIKASEIDSAMTKTLMSRLLEISISAKEVSDTLVLTIQSVCELIISTLNFDAAWTMLLEMVSLRSLILLAFLLARDDVDSETVTSKQLGQVILSLGDLATTSSSTCGVDSWATIADSAWEMTAAIERCISQFLMHCTLRKLDKMFRRLVSTLGVEDGKQEIRLALVLRVYAAVCEQGGSAVSLALLPLISDEILKALDESTKSRKSSKRKRNADVLMAALRAVTASCVEEIPEAHIFEFIDAVSEIPGHIDDQSVVSDTCIALARVGSTDQIKSFTKRLMQRTVDDSAPLVQAGVVGTVLAMWKGVGESMVPAITEVTVFLNQVFNSSDPEVRAVTKQLVKEIDRVTGEDIEGKLTGAERMEEE